MTLDGMDKARSVHYVRCAGSKYMGHPPGADSIIIRITMDGDQSWFGGYVVLNAENEVIEKSSHYGLFDGEAWAFDVEPDCQPASRGEFETAWDRPYARRSRWRRFLSSLNGADDRERPDDGLLVT